NPCLTRVELIEPLPRGGESGAHGTAGYRGMVVVSVETVKPNCRQNPPHTSPKKIRPDYGPALRALKNAGDPSGLLGGKGSTVFVPAAERSPTTGRLASNPAS